MKKIFISFLVVFALLLISINLSAQENRTITTKIADLLAQMPANNLPQRDKLMEELISWGDEGFQKLADQMTPSGKGDNSAVVFAINGLARYACQNAKEDKRAFAEKNFILAMNKTPDAETKAFFMRQLQLVGNDDAAKAVAPYLSDNELCEPATFILTTVASETAKNELLTALTKAQGNSLVTITKALGELRFKPANDQILKTIASDNQNLKKVSLAAVASIAAPASYQPLLDAARKAGFVYEPSDATQEFVTYAQRLAENGETKLSAAACEELMQLSLPNQLHTNAAALAIYTKYFETEAQPKLLKAFDSNDKAFRVAILNLVEKSKPASTKQWIAKASNAESEVKAEVITMLGRRGDLSASEFIKKQFADNSPAVSEAAIIAYSKLKGKDAIPDLVVLLKSGTQPEFTSSALMSLMDQKSLDPLAAILGSSPEQSKIAIIEIIGAKSGKRYFDQVYSYTSSSNAEIKSAAFAAMKNISAAKDIDRLLKLLFATDDNIKIENIQDALVNAASDLKGEDNQAAPLLAQLPTAPQKGRILEILPRLGGKQALKVVTGYIGSSNKEESEAALNALINWKDASAAPSLYEICCASNGERRSDALVGFVHQISKSTLPDDQKLLQYRKMLSYATDNNDRTLIIRSMGKIRTFLSLVTTVPFLDDPDLKNDACLTVMEITLPAEGQKGMSGVVVRNALNKVITTIAGDESDYNKASIVKYLAEMSYEDGLVPMFNGKDLSGWHGLAGTPVTRKTMDAKEFAKKQAEADLKLKNNWSVKDGCITFNGEGDNLCSVKQYGDFEMVVDWRITKKGDSGIYLRGSPQVQIWDTSRVEVGAQVGSGGLYNNKTNRSTPLKVADNPVGEWNTFRIKMIGDRVTVFLNGELVVDNVILENYWDRSIPIFPKEAIELQAHGTDLAFRDIYVQELSNNEYTVSDEESKEGFKALFNGKDLEGWTGNLTDYKAKNGEIVIHVDNGPTHGNLFTKDEYSDFVYRFEFQLTPGANNGLGIRAPLEGDAAYVGMELQILDNEDPIYATLAPYQYHGSVYGVIPAKRGYLKPVGQWNDEEVIAKGSHIKITLNGTVILDGDIKEASKNGTMDHKEHTGLLRAKGHIGFLGHGSVVKFKNIRVKDLSKK
jgi:HEAT repeat protein